MKKISILLVITVVAAISALLYWTNGITAVNRSETSKKIFVITPGEPIREIGSNLKKQGLIRDAVVFFIYLKLHNQDKSIQAGDYRLSPSMNLAKLVDNLNHGTLDHWATIPEGLRAQEIADILKKDLPSFDDSWREKLDAQEGYLFPDTYLIPKGADADTIISMMRNNFNRKIASTGLTSESPNLGETIIIASLIEREAKHAEDMGIVSSVIHNRLDIGMKLDIDATIQYALGYQPGEARWWKRSLTNYDISLNSPYNTYRNAGLPPTPISNPGINSINAALHPAGTNYLYYVNDKNGKIHGARTIEEHNANIQKYL